MFYQELKAVNYYELIRKVFMHVQKNTRKYRDPHVSPRNIVISEGRLGIQDRDILISCTMACTCCV